MKLVKGLNRIKLNTQSPLIILIIINKIPINSLNISYKANSGSLRPKKLKIL